MNQVMDKELDDAQFWLPSEFLTDEELLNDFKGFNSDLSSPVESVFGSNETESDEDDVGSFQKLCIAEILSPEEDSFMQKLSRSPQSTLYSCKAESTRSSPNCVSSPPDSKDSGASDLLYVAAAEARRQIDETAASYFSNSFYGPTTQKLNNQVTGPVKSPNQYFSNQAQAQADADFFIPTQLELQMIREREAIVFATMKAGAWPFCQKSQQPPPPPPRQRTGTGMRPVFLGETGVRKERIGTGVFLPRRFENNVQKKPGCSVLLPEKVVHALNLNLDSMDSSSHTRSVAAADRGVGFLNQNNNVKFGQQKQSFRPQQQQQQQQVVKQELGLPQEWTY